MEICTGNLCFCAFFVTTLLFNDKTCMYFALNDTIFPGCSQLYTIFSWGMHNRDMGGLDLEDFFIIQSHTFHNGGITDAI